MGLFNNVFSKQQINNSKELTQFKFVGNNYNPITTIFGGNIYEIDTVRACVNTIASNTAKLKPVHQRVGADGKLEIVNSNLSRLLQLRPNQYMDAYSFYYKVVTQLYTKNNSFIYIHRDDFGNVMGLYPIDFSTIETLEDRQGNIYTKFRFLGGQTVTIPYESIIHLRRFYNENDIYGDSNSALFGTIEVNNTITDGIINAVKSSALLRGLMKFTSVMRPDDIKKQTDAFVRDYMSMSNSGGIAGLDAKADYISLTTDNKILDAEQMKYVDEKFYKYFSLNENIIKSMYSESEWDAFYESVVEPIAIQLSLQFTSKLFTDREMGFGNQIVFEANRLQYVSAKTKVSLVKELMPLGLFSVNEAREIFNLSSVEGGDKRVQTLNVANVDIIDSYQLNNKDKTKKKVGEDVDE